MAFRFRSAGGVKTKPYHGNVNPDTLLTSGPKLFIDSRGGDVKALLIASEYEITRVTAKITRYRTTTHTAIMGGTIGFVPPWYTLTDDGAVQAQGMSPTEPTMVMLSGGSNLTLPVAVGAHARGHRTSDDIRFLSADLGVFGVFAAGTMFSDSSTTPAFASKGSIRLIKTRTRLPRPISILQEPWWFTVEGHGYSKEPITVKTLHDKLIQHIK